MNELTPLRRGIHDVLCTDINHGYDHCLFDGVLMTMIVGIEQLMEARECRLVDAAVAEARRDLLLNPKAFDEEHQKMALELSSQGKTMREISTIMGYKNGSPGSAGWLLKKARNTQEQS